MLYHGSQYFIKDKLKPNSSLNQNGKSLVYATDDWLYALIRSGQFDSNKFLLYEDYYGIHNNITLIELEKEAFNKLFNCEGYIYYLDNEKFQNSNLPNEFISDECIEILRYDIIGNILDYLSKDDRINMIYYQSKEFYNFFKNVNGGYEGYINRKINRLKNLK